MLALSSSTPALSGSTSTRYGAELTFEDLPCDGGPSRVREREDTLLRVIAGLVCLETDDTERVLQTGEEAIVPAGTRHRLTSVYGTAQIVTGFRPAQR